MSRTLQWLRRRRRGVTATPTVALGLLPERLAGYGSTLADFRPALGVEPVLEALRPPHTHTLRGFPEEHSRRRMGDT